MTGKARPLVLWGCGEIATEALRCIKGLNIVACVDRKAEQKKGFGGKEVLAPSDFFNRFLPGKCLVIVCANPFNSQEITKLLESNGFRYGEDVLWFWEFYEHYYNRLCLEWGDFIHLRTDVSFHVTDFCTLRCKNCSLALPYRQERIHETLESVQRDTELFFAKADYCESLAFLGGEILLWPHLAPFAYWLKETCSRQYSQARIITNCVTPFSHEALKSLADNDFLVELTAYPGIISTDRMEQICRLLDEFGIKRRIICHDAWNDFGIIQGKHHAERDNQDIYQRCISLCRGVWEGNYIFCTPGFFQARAKGTSLRNGSGMLSFK